MQFVHKGRCNLLLRKVVQCLPYTEAFYNVDEIVKYFLYFRDCDIGPAALR